MGDQVKVLMRLAEGLRDIVTLQMCCRGNDM